MDLFGVLQAHGIEVKAEDCKFHFARSPHQKDKDLFATRAGFDTFQSGQVQKNFSRPYVISFYEHGDGRWMFAGVWQVIADPVWDESLNLYRYKFLFLEAAEKLERRLVVSWQDRFRNSYPNGETLANQLEIACILSTPDVLGRFPGYSKIRISMEGLRSLRQDPAGSIGWKTALENVAGVYVIADTKKEKLYVGSAYGEANLWQRWSKYAETGHGDNKALIAEYRERGDAVFSDYVFSLLWHADSSANEDEVLAMESHWKEALLTRGDRGYNKN